MKRGRGGNVGRGTQETNNGGITMMNLGHSIEEVGYDLCAILDSGCCDVYRRYAARWK